MMTKSNVTTINAFFSSAWLRSRCISLFLCLAVAPVLNAGDERRLSAKQVFDLDQPVIFSDDFQSGKINLWNISENDQYRIAMASPERIAVEEAPLLAGRKAVRMMVNRAPNSFRSEISLPYEKGFNERWYGQRIFVPEEWVLDESDGNDIVMQWHAIPGNGKATYPNLEISVGNDQWFIRQSFGNTLPKPTRTHTKLDEPLKRGVWSAWVIHAKWSPKDDGLLQIWKDGKVVFERKGPNVYDNIGEDYTPYFKTGIYHPEWHTDSDRKLAAFHQEKPAATRKVIYVTDFKMGNERARFEDIAPAPLK
ncbi:MAG: polysaccharide lyase [Verrucomicrobiaceae bacterium]|nr:polysaccharide lyase [Verrucomicrobiaceae bacterium]